jgi:hypothetical protein
MVIEPVEDLDVAAVGQGPVGEVWLPALVLAPLPSQPTAKSGAAQKDTIFFTAEHWVDFPEGAPFNDATANYPRS